MNRVKNLRGPLYTGTIIVLVITTFTACCVSLRNETPVTPPNMLEEREWHLVSYLNTSETLVPVLTNSTITAHFSVDGKLTGSAGCNHYFASFNRTGTSLRITAIGLTKMFCTQPPDLMEQEQIFVNILQSGAGYEIAGDRLTLSNASGQTILSFQAAA